MVRFWLEKAIKIILFNDDVVDRKQASLPYKDIDLICLQNLIFCKGVNP